MANCVLEDMDEEIQTLVSGCERPVRRPMISECVVCQDPNRPRLHFHMQTLCPLPHALEVEIGFSVAPILARPRRYRLRFLSLAERSVSGQSGNQCQNPRGRRKPNNKYNLFIGSAGGWVVPFVGALGGFCPKDLILPNARSTPIYPQPHCFPCSCLFVPSSRRRSLLANSKRAFNSSVPDLDIPHQTAVGYSCIFVQREPFIHRQKGSSGEVTFTSNVRRGGKKSEAPTESLTVRSCELRWKPTEERE